MKLLVTLALVVNILFACDHITSGERDGRYYEFAQNLSSKVDGVCVQKSKGTPNNIYTITTQKEIVMGIFQSDNMKLARENDSSNKLKNLKVLFPIFKEQVHLIVLKSSGIRNLNDLKRKDIAVGDELSGSYVSFLNISEKLNMDWVGINYHFSDGMEKLRNGEVEAMFIVGKAPIKALVPYMRYIKFLDIDTDIPDYQKAVIYAKSYSTDKNPIKNNIQTLEVDALLLIDESKVTDPAKITELSKIYIDSMYKVKEAGGIDLFNLAEVQNAIDKGTQEVTNIINKYTGGASAGAKKKILSKIEKIEEICQTNVNSLTRFGFERSHIAIDTCNQYKANNR